MPRIVRPGGRRPTFRFGLRQRSMPGFELRVVPEPLDRGHPGRDLARRRHRAARGVIRSGIVKTNPASPSVSGSAPRSLASTGIPLAIASVATRPSDSRHNDGISTTRLTR